VTHRLACLLVLTLLFAPSSFAAGPRSQSWFPVAPPLPKPAGDAVRVATAAGLARAIKAAKPGSTIALADGHYHITSLLELRTDNVTLRSASGERDKVVLDGGGKLGELLAVTRSSGVTIADLTIQNVKWNGVKLNANQGVNRITIRNCVIHNVWQRGIKSGIVPEQDREKLRPFGCRVEYCLFYNDRPKQLSDDDDDRFSGDYIGGLDIMHAKNWTISDNVFVGIQGRNREARGAIFLWVESEDCTIERNILIDCDSGICLGNSYKAAESQFHCRGCIVRNNFLTRCPENGILADYTRDCQLLHNTIHDPKSRQQRLIRIVHDNEGLVVANNLLSGSATKVETESRLRMEGNVTKDMTQSFADPEAGNLHLKPEAVKMVGTVKRLADAPQDIDGQERSEMTTVGAGSSE
jgi:hypothetical protein